MNILEMLECFGLLHDEKISFRGTKWLTVVWAVGAILCGVGVDVLGWLLQVSSGKDFVLLFSGVDGYSLHDFYNTGRSFRFWFGKSVMFRFSFDMLVTSKLISLSFSVSFVSKFSGFMFLKYSKVFRNDEVQIFQTFFPALLQTDYFIFHSVGSPLM